MEHSFNKYIKELILFKLKELKNQGSIGDDGSMLTFSTLWASSDNDVNIIGGIGSIRRLDMGDLASSTMLSQVTNQTYIYI